MWNIMACSLPSPGHSCGSPYSDVTSGSPQCSDHSEPPSPDISFASLPNQFVVRPSIVVQPTADSYDKKPQTSKMTDEELDFYKNLNVGSEHSIELHSRYVAAKIQAGVYQVEKPADPNSATPYSDVAQPKKQSKNGAIKRPMNAFMSFSKCERYKLTAGKSSIHNATISQHLGVVWKQFSHQIKDYFKEYSNFLKTLHDKEFPGYKYRPQKKKSSSSEASAMPDEDGKMKTVSKTSKPRSRVRKSAAKPYHTPEDYKAELSLESEETMAYPVEPMSVDLPRPRANFVEPMPVLSLEAEETMPFPVEPMSVLSFESEETMACPVKPLSVDLPRSQDLADLVEPVPKDPSLDFKVEPMPVDLPLPQDLADFVEPVPVNGASGWDSLDLEVLLSDLLCSPLGPDFFDPISKTDCNCKVVPNDLLILEDIPKDPAP